MEPRGWTGRRTADGGYQNLIAALSRMRQSLHGRKLAAILPWLVTSWATIS
jgi:hypothetical protein